MLWQLPDIEFKSPTRSTIPLLDYWREPYSVVKELMDLFKLPFSENWEVHFEYPVPSAFPTAKPSFTDVMCIAEKAAVIGVEGKWTEKAHGSNGYAYVGKWCNSVRREKVLDHWISLIEPFSEGDINRGEVDGVVYQMLHRTASVCHTAKSVGAPKALVLYQKFFLSGEQHTDEYERELRSLVKSINPASSLEIALMLCEIEPIDLKVRDAIISKNSSINIRDKLLMGKLFNFGKPEIIHIER